MTGTIPNGAVAASPLPKNAVEDKFTRLPDFASPTLYQIRLAPCLESFKYKGEEKIHLDIKKPTNFLKLHASGLEIEAASLRLADGTRLELRIEVDTKWTLLTLHLPHEIGPQQQVVLEIAFNGEIRSELEGFYRSPYKDASGKEHFLASTQFESVYARKAFPCWDEPVYKAEFDVKLEVDPGLCALSNMNVESEELMANGAKKLVHFARTPRMSTYLVAFAIGHFEYLEDRTKAGCIVRVYTVPGKRDKGGYALGVAVRAIEWFSEWYGIEMPLPKCDLICIPEFAMGAMENWGLITAREAGLLYDAQLTSSAVKQRITVVVTHEIGHFWFGNLVTMKWWSDLWLKEGFASFMEYVFTGYNYPEFKIWLDFLNGETRVAMKLDALRNSHPIEIPIDNPNELDEIYDNITYAKSNSVIRMLFAHVGERTIQKGLRLYLARHKYGNTETEDLWQCLTEASGIDVSALMGSWTRQVGFPLISVDECQLAGRRRQLRVAQRRFLADGQEVEGDGANALWQVPIPVSSSAQPDRPKAKFLLTKAEDTFVLEDVDEGEWVKLNSGFSSFFRVKYSEPMFARLLEGVRSGRMDVLDRFQMCNDLFAIIQSGQAPLSKFLELFSACGQEGNLVVWQSISASLAEIDQVLGHLGDGDVLKGRFHGFICKMVEPVAERLGWEPVEGEDMQTGQLRALLLNLLARSQHQPTIRQALAKFHAHVQEGTELVPDLRALIFAIAARTNQPKMVAQLQVIMGSCNFNEVERSCVLALGQCSEPELLEQIYTHGIVERNIKSQDVFYLFMAANQSGNAGTQRHAWHFFKTNLKLFLDLWGSPTAALFQECFKSASERFCTEQAAEEVLAFCKSNFDENAQKTLDRPIRQVMETIRLNERLLENNTGDMEQYLQNVGY